jgi:hypothetical protein
LARARPLSEVLADPRDKPEDDGALLSTHRSPLSCAVMIAGRPALFQLVEHSNAIRRLRLAVRALVFRCQCGQSRIGKPDAFPL